LGLDSRDLLEIVLESHEKSFLIPAHIWTPWFSVLGSKSGFDSIEECYGDLSKHIFALETGLSSDPLMNWRLSILDPYILISNSDAHSASKLGREANIFDADFSYTGIYNSLSDPNDKGLLGTIEFYPEEGKYHYDGHSACKQRMAPNETIASKGLCPVCGKKVTVGVMARVEALADRKQGEKSKRPREFKNLIPLCEIIADAKGMKSTTSKTVEECYYALLNKLGNELFILQDASIKEIAKISTIVSEGIKRVRQKKVLISPGYDGEYGKIKLFEENERNNKESQFALF